jgi:hypothetical protein
VQVLHESVSKNPPDSKNRYSQFFNPKGCYNLKPVSKPRKGWEKAFEKMAENGDDNLLIDDVFEDENPEEWK